MNVALVHYSLRRGGGMESYLADLVRGFRAAGDSVDVWAREVDADWARTLGANARRLLPLPLPRAFRNRAFASRIAALTARPRESRRPGDALAEAPHAVVTATS